MFYQKRLKMTWLYDFVAKKLFFAKQNYIYEFGLNIEKH